MALVLVSYSECACLPLKLLEERESAKDSLLSIRLFQLISTMQKQHLAATQSHLPRPQIASLGSGHHQPSARGEKVHGRFSQPGKVQAVPAREQRRNPKKEAESPTSHRGAAPSDRRRGTEWIEDENTAAVAVSMPTLADRAFVKLLAAAVSETACLNRNASCWPSIWRLDSTRVVTSADHANGNQEEQGSNTAVAAVVVKRLCGARLSSPKEEDSPRLREDPYYWVSLRNLRFRRGRAKRRWHCEMPPENQGPTKPHAQKAGDR